VVYHIWGRAGLWAREYTVNDDGAIKFSADEEAVNLLTRIVPRQTNEPNINANGNERNDEMAGNNSGEGNKPGTNDAGTGAPGQEGNQPNANAQQGQEGAAGAGAGAVESGAAAPSFDQLLAAASGETRESIEYGQRMFKARKEELVKGLLACERNKFSEEQLKAFGIDQLENLATLAEVKPNFTGRAAPQGQEGISANTAGDAGMKVAKAQTSYLTADASAE
jgi:hypothetical protein